MHPIGFNCDCNELIDVCWNFWSLFCVAGFDTSPFLASPCHFFPDGIKTCSSTSVCQALRNQTHAKTKLSLIYRSPFSVLPFFVHHFCISISISISISIAMHPLSLFYRFSLRVSASYLYFLAFAVVFYIYIYTYMYSFLCCFCLVFVVFVLCSRWSLADVPLTLSCPADHVLPD